MQFFVPSFMARRFERVENVDGFLPACSEMLASKITPRPAAVISSGQLCISGPKT
jgi:hypothetical protein